jgi:hypothetical protein
MDLVPRHEEVKEGKDDESGEEEPLYRNPSCVEIFKESCHHPPPTSLVILRKKSG